MMKPLLAASAGSTPYVLCALLTVSAVPALFLALDGLLMVIPQTMKPAALSLTWQHRRVVQRDAIQREVAGARDLDQGRALATRSVLVPERSAAADERLSTLPVPSCAGFP
jgi:hypothetical protein